MLTPTTDDDDSWSRHDGDCAMLQGFQRCRKNGRSEGRKKLRAACESKDHKTK